VREGTVLLCAECALHRHDQNRATQFHGMTRARLEENVADWSVHTQYQTQAPQRDALPGINARAPFGSGVRCYVGVCSPAAARACLSTSSCPPSFAACSMRSTMVGLEELGWTRERRRHAARAAGQQQKICLKNQPTARTRSMRCPIEPRRTTEMAVWMSASQIKCQPGIESRICSRAQARSRDGDKEEQRWSLTLPDLLSERAPCELAG